MKYRSKLYIALVGTAFVSAVLGLSVVYVETRYQFKRELESEVLSIAAIAATQINPEQLRSIRSRQDETSPEYIEIRDQLRRVRNANRRSDIYVKFVYTLMKNPRNPNQLLYGVDAEEKPQDFSNAGDIDLNTGKHHLLQNLDANYSPERFVTDQWGVWLSGFSPVFDSEGKYVGTVGVDLKAQEVISQLDKLVDLGLWALAGSLLLALIGAMGLSRQVTRSLSALCTCVAEIGRGNLKKKAVLKTHDEFGALAAAINDMARGLQERERLKTSFSRYVSRHVLEKILKSEAPARLEGERRKITVIFTDIRHFAQLAELLPPEKVVSLLNEFFERMLDVIFKNFGTLDKFLGDGIMVEFGAPLDDEMQEVHAVKAAIEMQRELKKLCEKWDKEGKPRFEMGIGIHTGIAVVGNIGSEKRMEYTAIGDTVNVASRLEQASKEFNMPILISETTFNGAKKTFRMKSLGPLTLRGKTEEIAVYSVEELEP